MTDFFDWHSDDEDAWDSPIQTAGEAGNRRSIDRLQKVILIASAVVLFLLLAIPVRQGANQVIDSTTFGMQSELLAANQLVLEAALAGDVELFSQLVSRRDMQWYSDQRVIARRQLSLDRAPLALWLDRPALEASDAPFRAATVALAPDLTSAEVSTTLPYLVLTAGGAVLAPRRARPEHSSPLPRSVYRLGRGPALSTAGGKSQHVPRSPPSGRGWRPGFPWGGACGGRRRS